MELKPEQVNRNIKIHNDCDGLESIPEEKIFSEDELENISGLGDVLQDIRKRLISEGFSIDELRDKFNAENAIM